MNRFSFLFISCIDSSLSFGESFYGPLVSPEIMPRVLKIESLTFIVDLKAIKLSLFKIS
jgi:hypothetical protein